MTNISREFVAVRECRSCAEMARVIVREFVAPVVVNAGTQFEWIQTESVSKCGRCYL